MKPDKIKDLDQLSVKKYSNILTKTIDETAHLQLKIRDSAAFLGI